MAEHHRWTIAPGVPSHLTSSPDEGLLEVHPTILAGLKSGRLALIRYSPPGWFRHPAGERLPVTQQAPSTSASAIAARGVWPDIDPMAGALLATCAPGSVVQSLAPLLRLPLGALTHP
jgi:hypothetical protein